MCSEVLHIPDTKWKASCLTLSRAGSPARAVPHEGARLFCVVKYLGSLCLKAPPWEFTDTLALCGAEGVKSRTTA